MKASKVIESVKSTLLIDNRGSNNSTNSKVVQDIGVPASLLDITKPNGLQDEFTVLLHIHFLLNETQTLETIELLNNYNGLVASRHFKAYSFPYYWRQFIDSFD